MTDPSNVVPLKPADPDEEDRVWCCAHCDGTAFDLYADGSTGCRGCGFRGDYPPGRWTSWRPVDEEEPTVARSTTLFDSASFAQQSIFRSIDEDTSVMVVAGDSGKIRAWSRYGHAASHEAKVTVRYLLGQAVTLILGEPPIPRPDDALDVTE